MRRRLNWLSLHGVIRGASAIGMRHGEPQARMLADPKVRADPVAFYEELRTRGTVVRSRIGYIAVGYDAAFDVLRSDDFTVITFGGRLPKPLRRLEQRTRDARLHPLRPPSLLAVEPPDHTRYRKTVSAVFTRRAVTTLQERVRETAEALLDGLETRADGGPGGTIDIVREYCAQLPVAIISEILGVQDADRPKVLELGELAAPCLDIGLRWQEYLQVEQGLAEFSVWLRAHIQELRRGNGDDLMSRLIRTSQDGQYLTDLELEATAGLVLAAGFETTVNLLGNGIRLLLDHPDQLTILRQRPELWPNAVEEILRYDSPVQLSARVARVQTDIAGKPVRRGQAIVAYLAAANRDPAVFADPHRFDVTRPNANKHLSFSGGRHFCLGAALARSEGEVGLRTLFERFPEIGSAGAGERRPTRVLRGWTSLPVTLGRPAARTTG
ncbi:cytochrome P450 [Aldersonia sp. NBC_00410]|uniref:cytochrome P450 n=1 Tax=Aldersonia sp. NBC_00410 TaxID=2975954 RepID=UPI00225A18D2|nr:cytochrome P450 [Aldersonia sp. NBC_00410]MCX5042916.1 cytochrome P450 [Aldersonia sp. NBC_00410]